MNEHFYQYWSLSLTMVTKGEKTFAGGGGHCCLESLGWSWGPQVPSRSPIPTDRLTQPPASPGERGSSNYTLEVTDEYVFLYFQECLLKMEVAETGEDALDSGPTWSLLLF